VQYIATASFLDLRKHPLEAPQKIFHHIFLLKQLNISSHRREKILNVRDLQNAWYSGHTTSQFDKNIPLEFFNTYSDR
jgi:hypothetical protein